MRYGYDAIYLYVQDEACFFHCASVATQHFKAPPNRREIFVAVETTTISPKFRVDCGKEIRVVIHTNASVLW